MVWISSKHVKAVSSSKNVDNELGQQLPKPLSDDLKGGQSKLDTPRKLKPSSPFANERKEQFSSRFWQQLR